MDSAKLHEWLQIVGIFALVASLIFVGLQLKQGHEIALATQYQARSQATLDHFDTMIEAHIPGEEYDVESGDLMPPDDDNISQLAEYWNIHWEWTHLDNNHYQYQAGFLSEEAWDSLRRRLVNLYGSCEKRFVYDDRKLRFRTSFLQLIESLDDPCRQTN